MIHHLRVHLRRLFGLPERPTGAEDQALLATLQRAAPPVRLPLDPLPDLSGRRIVDVGCGLGDRTRAYAARGARLVVGVEIDPGRARMAARLNAGDGRVTIIIASAAALPFADHSVDLFLSSDTWEHLLDPRQALLEARRLLASPGELAISFLPYYSPWGAHAWHWLPLPWVQLFLPRRLLFRLLARLERRRRINPTLPPAIRVPWAHPVDPALPQGLTIGAMGKHLRATGFATASLVLSPLLSGRATMAAALFGWFGRLPVLCELFSGVVIVRFRRREPPGALHRR